MSQTASRTRALTSVSKARAGVIDSNPPALAWVLWIATSTVLATATTLLIGANSSIAISGMLNLYLIGIAIQCIVAYIVMIGAAHSHLSRASYLSSLKWVVTHALPRAALILSLGLVFVILIFVNGFAVSALNLNVIGMVLMVITIATGLRVAYRARYDELNPKKIAVVKDSLWQRLLNRVKPHSSRLIFPLLQSVIITMLPSYGLLWLGLDTLKLDYTLVTIVVSSLMPVWAILWAQWHRSGGLMKVVKLGKGREM